MAPFVTLDLSDDIDFTSPPVKSATAQRTLLLAPPSIAAHPDALNNVLSSYDRNAIDLQMLDRLAAGIISLPVATYDVVLLLSDADGSRQESRRLLGRDVIGQLAQSLKSGGRLKSQDGAFGNTNEEKTEAILAGLVQTDAGFSKPEEIAVQSVPLRFGKKKKAAETNGTAPPVKELNGNGKRPSPPAPVIPAGPTGVGFVDFSDDLELVTGEDDDLIDEDELLTEEDMNGNIIQRKFFGGYTNKSAVLMTSTAPECRPKAGKRRRACKDCSCGLKEKIEAEDEAKRAAADKALNTIKLDADDMAEIDFTVQGKVGSCGNCALGDAFRCDGCPYIGLPAFKPGEEVRLVNMDVQL